MNKEGPFRQQWGYTGCERMGDGEGGGGQEKMGEVEADDTWGAKTW